MSESPVCTGDSIIEPHRPNDGLEPVLFSRSPHERIGGLLDPIKDLKPSTVTARARIRPFELDHAALKELQALWTLDQSHATGAIRPIGDHVQLSVNDLFCRGIEILENQTHLVGVSPITLDTTFRGGFSEEQVFASAVEPDLGHACLHNTDQGIGMIHQRGFVAKTRIFFSKASQRNLKSCLLL
jgi:hypothetical protein